MGYVPSLTDLIAEKMRSDEDFTQFADRWRLLAAKIHVPIPEVEQINLIVNNSNPYLRTWLSLTGMPVTFAELYSRGRSIQIQLRDPSFQLYLPRPKKKEPVPTTEGTTSNEQVTTMSTYSRPAQGAQRSSQPPHLPNQLTVPEAFKPQANAGPSQVHRKTPACNLHVYPEKATGRRQHITAWSGNLHLEVLRLTELTQHTSKLLGNKAVGSSRIY